MLYDIVLSLLVALILIVVFVRMVQDYRVVLTISKLLQKNYKVEYSKCYVINLGLSNLCRNFIIENAYSPQGHVYLVGKDTVIICDALPDIQTRTIKLYVTVKVIGKLSEYTITKSVNLVFQ
jgi:hypothetical protein